jgi:hypothetical protein
MICEICLLTGLHFRKSEGRFIGGNRDIAAGDDRKGAAEAISDYCGVRRNRKGALDSHAPLERLVQQALELHAVALLVEKFFQIFTGGKTFACAGEDKHAQILVES